MNVWINKYIIIYRQLNVYIKFTWILLHIFCVYLSYRHLQLVHTIAQAIDSNIKYIGTMITEHLHHLNSFTLTSKFTSASYIVFCFLLYYLGDQMLTMNTYADRSSTLGWSSASAFFFHELEVCILIFTYDNSEKYMLHIPFSDTMPYYSNLK